MELEKNYNSKEAEARIYKLWEESGFFNPDKLPGNRKETFSVALPPPNATGTLHLGHALEYSLQDAVVRYHRMKGKKTLWLPGTDHAAIATNTKVEKMMIKQEGKSRHDIGREAFVKRVEDFVANSRSTIQTQIRKIGASLDWSREAFTLDEKRNLAVRTAFKRMYDQTLIYRGARIVNWDPELQTTVSDDEIEWKEETANLYHLKYGPFIITTARPETKFGDKYVVMHPNDERYKDYEDGQKIDLEWINGPVKATIIKDEVIDMEFGTGVMTITPAHDATDFDIAERHNLEMPQVIDEKGKLLPIAGEFAGAHIKKARALVVEKLKSKGLVEKIESNYVHNIATNSRGGGVIEPQIKEQWFVDVNRPFVLKNSRIPGIESGASINLKHLMRHTVESGIIKILPEHEERKYFHWINNLRDWCISRQLWYGHRIPVWYCGQRDVKRMGYSADGVPLVMNGERKTYRVEDYGLPVGSKVILENSSTSKVFGYATITGVELKPLHKINLKDPLHGRKYENHQELVDELNSYRVPVKVGLDSTLWVYTYDFNPNLERGNCGTMVVSIDEPNRCPACGSESLEQDPDTLDTWFSSGLWTFSTLGWPDERSKDLEAFHPTSFINPGYEILFFWVARMILMTGFLLGDIPFRIVYLHGMLRDSKGQKFSKSLDTGIDPVKIIDEYGADALRMSIIVGIGPGNDGNFDLNKVRGYKNFSNKLWNITRFVLMSADDADMSASLTPEDQTIMDELRALLADVTKDMEEFRFYLAAEKLYHYVWHTFADKILEESKAKLASDDAQVKSSAKRMLIEVLVASLKLLHPFMPFVTEELYGKLPLPNKQLLMVESWPTV